MAGRTGHRRRHRQLDPDDPIGWFNRSYALHELKRTAEARDNLLRVEAHSIFLPAHMRNPANLWNFISWPWRLKTWTHNALDWEAPPRNISNMNQIPTTEQQSNSEDVKLDRNIPCGIIVATRTRSSTSA